MTELTVTCTLMNDTGNTDRPGETYNFMNFPIFYLLLLASCVMTIAPAIHRKGFI